MLKFVLDLYRLAQDAPLAEFPDLALGMLGRTVRFRTATWSEAKMTPTAFTALSVHPYKEPPEVRFALVAQNQKHMRGVTRAARQPGRAALMPDSMAFYRSREEAPMRAYLKRYGHQRNLLITDLTQWLSLYRPAADDPFTERDAAIMNLLLPHLAEAYTINRSLTVDGLSQDRQRRGGRHALVDATGAFLHCGIEFLELLRDEWRDWSEPRIPPRLLALLQRNRRVRIAGGRVEISAQAFGEALALTGRRVVAFDHLSPREIEVAREFGAGKSHKTVARDLGLAPATVRNVLQKVYRKLEIDDKATLAKLLERGRG